ncbi:FERM, ARHGEF and pleckstrin domain-containing protein 2 isoform X1 [Delphinapterus leucas]|uniref:FERM, ARHGEF and pleckstrin domain-containing protein 2 isoform X1 n=2 Tax=Delphinapterus leucas TaxID=9749 RepID=A0A2Y9MSL0_DELLE|nr:FERM, ARHGEF and pleckstrin domain-containing protein 2 isoform X1 [Delphinapterus leucas]XP_022423915.1 FERM, ARHGEF and pleckstrin domain-containing protein 2 isoform X1 [Delphinapterus leucas]XP_022423916.1 FERM, ARHGEF and pleckstrin domain-containing protein 2 isoform X1 [Delphinapterus leucas]
MGELEGTYRVLQTPGTRLGAQTPAGVSTLEPGHGPSAAAAWPAARTPIRVQLLDSSVEVFDVEPKCYGQVLLTQVWKRLNLIECDYFGLEFQNVQSCWIWLEPMKPIVRQVRRPKNTVLRLAVKFFPPDPGQLQEEYTRYLFALQLKRDLLEERLTCTDTTAALLASHLLQAEIGDYEEALVREHLRAHEYLPGQERALERILELHRGHAGQTPAESDFQVLEIARKLEMYGIRFHMASDREGTKINLAVSHMGVLVFQSCACVRLQMFLNERLCPEFQSSTKINTFNWSRLRKLSFKRKRFLIKLHPEVHGPYQDTLEFVLGSRDACKNFWKTCVEYHTFFRLSDQPKPRARAILFSRGSSFRYSGRTQKQLVDYVKDGGMKRIPYERKHSKTQMSLRALNANLPRQSILFTEGTRTPASPSSTSASFCSGPASPPAPVGLLGSKDSSSSPTGPPAPSARWPAAERSGVAAAPPPGPPAFQPCQGLSVESPQLPSTRKTPPSLSPLGPAEQGSSPLLSPVLSDAGGAGMDDQEELRHKCAPADEAYFIAKEILATERTYLKDLEVITVWFRSAVVKADAMPADLMTLLFSNVDPIYEFHRGFLREVEQRLALWEGSSSAQATGDHRRIGDVLLSNMLQLKALTRHFQRLHEVLTELEAASRRLRRLEALRRDFELQKVCYLPLNAFLLKPLQRLRHYRLLLRRLCAPDRQDPGQDPDRGDQDRADRREALKAITEVTSTLQHSLVRLENLQKLMELQRDLVGIENLIAPGREFIREGCLHKLTRKGLQQRMFFLFSDMLLYTGRGASGTSHFRIRGLLPLRGMLVEERENEWSVPHCFTIYAAQKTVVVAASTQLEKEKWMRDLNAAIDAAKSNADTALAPLGSVLCPHPRRPSDEVSLEESEDDARRARCSSGGPGQHRASTAMHVCWDRTTSISRADRSAAVENQLSGYLLRKFKNSSGWQKLWVVFTNFCLFFYKTHQVGVLHRARGGLCPWHCRTARPAHCALTEPPRFRTSLAPPLLPCGERRGAGRLASACPAAFQDDCPLASLPLLGYSVSLPGEADGIHKEHVFKLQFKSHVYFFRAESKYTLGRWMEVIESASTSPGRAGTSEEEA